MFWWSQILQPLPPLVASPVFFIGICLSNYNLNPFLIHQASYSKEYQRYLMHSENLGSIWKIGRYPIKVSEVLETGRWHKHYKTLIKERKRLFCNCLEDELYFVLECQVYQDFRNEYIKRYFKNRPNIPKFIELLKSEYKKTIKNSSVYKSIKKRNEL